MRRYFRWKRTPPSEGDVGKYKVRIKHNLRGRPSNVFVNGRRFVQGTGFRDLSLPKKGVIATEAAGGGYLLSKGWEPLQHLGTVVDAGIDIIKSQYQAGKAVLDLVFTGDEQKAIRSLEGIIHGSRRRDETAQVIEQYLDDFATYKSAWGIFEKSRADIESAMAKAAEAAKKVTPRLPTEDVYAKIHDWLLKLRGIQVDDPRYAEKNIPMIGLRKDTYDTLKAASDEVTKEMNKAKPDLGYAQNQMKTFNKAYQTLVREEEAIGQGVEKIDPRELKSLQKQIDAIKPYQGLQVHASDVLPIAGMILGAYVLYKYVIRPTKWVLHKI